MTTIPPSNAVPPPPAAVAPPPSATAASPAPPIGAGSAIATVLTPLPATLQSAGPGAVIAGTIVSIDNQGQAVLQTGSGPVVFQSTASLAVGQQISLQVQAGGTSPQALVLSAEANATATLAAAVTSGPAETAGPAAATPAATVAPSVTTGPVIIATVIGPAAAPPPPPTPSVPTASAVAPPTAQQPPAPGGASGAALPGQTGPSTNTPAAPAQIAGAPAPRAPLPSTVLSPPSNTLETPPPVGGSSPAVVPASSPTPSPVPALTAASPSTAVVPSPAGSTSPAAPAPSASAPPDPMTAAPSASEPTASPQISTRPLSVAIASYTAPSTGGSGDAPSASPPSEIVAPSTLPTPPAGTQVPLRLVAPLANLATATASASSGHVVATIVAQTPAGQTVVDTAIGRLAFTAPAAGDLAIGSQIAFEIAAPALRPGAAAPGAPLFAAGRGLAALAAEWPVLKTALTTLAAVNPAMARQLLETALPRPDSPRFLGQVLSLMASPADDVKALLGQAAVDSLLQAGRGDVTAHLNADLREMSRLNASATNWQVFYVPVLDSTEARQLRVFARRRKPGADAKRDPGGRFIVEVEFKEFGPLQLDGLVLKPRLDLILRSHAELPAALQTGIVDVFAQTCEAAGLQGKIFFQALPAFPVSPLDEMMKSPTPGFSV